MWHFTPRIWSEHYETRNAICVGPVSRSADAPARGESFDPGGRQSRGVIS